MLRWTTAGESHGRALVALVEGMVAGVQVTSAEIAGQLARRRLGYGRGARMKFEQDEVTVLAPTNEAFAALPAGALENLLKPENRGQLSAVLQHHVIAGRLGRDDIKKRRELTPLSGKSLGVELKRGNLEIGGARLASRDRSADNGVVHTSGAVLLP